MNEERMSVSKWKNKYRASSGWPNVQEAVDARKEQDKEMKRQADMLEAGARIKRGPGRPPKAEADAEA